jgi:hypothetical protein
VRIRHLIEHDNHSRLLDILQVRLSERIAHKDDTLVDGAGAGDAVDLPVFDGRGEIRNFELDQSAEGVLGGVDLMNGAGGVSESRQRTVPAIDDGMPADTAAGVGARRSIVLLTAFHRLLANFEPAGAIG